ncbi:MAG: hypothetical protein F4W93_14025 [Dehalococcoidia bacterium]|nr:hypothetical protein [Dehalococcoidia bacterium]
MFNERMTTNGAVVSPAGRELSAGMETASGLWVPEGSAVEMPYVAGPEADTGKSVVVHRFRFHDPRTGRSQICHVPAHPDAAPAEIEDMAAEAFESFLTDVRGLGPLNRHTPEQRKEIGAAIREFREYTAKRRRSAMNRIYF